MAAKIDICKSTCIKLGVEPIASLTESSKAARLCNTQYQPILDALLEDHYWNFASRRSSALALSSTSPEFGYAYRYTLPTDCLQVKFLNVEGYEWEVEDGYLLTDLQNAQIGYIRNDVTVADMSRSFRELLSHMLALDIGYSLTQNLRQMALLDGKTERYLSKARNIDAKEGTVRGKSDGTWLDSRQSYGPANVPWPR